MRYQWNKLYFFREIYSSSPERPRASPDPKFIEYVWFGLPKRSQIIPRASQSIPRPSPDCPQSVPDCPQTNLRRWKRMLIWKSVFLWSTCWGFRVSFCKFPIKIMRKNWSLSPKKHSPVDKFDSTPLKLQAESVHYLQHLRRVEHDPYIIRVTFAKCSNLTHIVYGSRLNAHKCRV